MWATADRIYSLIKLNYIREFPDATRKGDYPPAVWFDPANADTDGPIAGKVLEYDKYDGLLQHYYDQRGYDHRGIPTKATLKRLSLDDGGRGRGEIRSPDMKIKIKVIGPLMYEAGFSERDLEVPSAITAEALLDMVSIPRKRPRIVTRNGKAVAAGELLADGDKIAVSPIYSGG